MAVRQGCTEKCYWSPGPKSKCTCACKGNYHGAGGKVRPPGSTHEVDGVKLEPSAPGDTCPAVTTPGVLPGRAESEAADRTDPEGQQGWRPGDSAQPGATGPADGSALNAPTSGGQAVDHVAARSLADNAQIKLGEGAHSALVEAEVRRLNDGLGLGADDATVTEAVGVYRRTFGASPPPQPSTPAEAEQIAGLLSDPVDEEEDAAPGEEAHYIGDDGIGNTWPTGAGFEAAAPYTGEAVGSYATRQEAIAALAARFRET